MVTLKKSRTAVIVHTLLYFPTNMIVLCDYNNLMTLWWWSKNFIMDKWFLQFSYV